MIFPVYDMGRGTVYTCEVELTPEEEAQVRAACEAGLEVSEEEGLRALHDRISGGAGIVGWPAELVEEYSTIV